MDAAARKPYPSDVSDEEWHFVLPYLTLMRADAPQRHHDLREVFNALRWVVRTGAQWDYLPHEFPAWPAVYQQARRWIAAGRLRGDGPRSARAAARGGGARAGADAPSSSTAARCNRPR